jgi:hypothetical protein
VSVQSLLVQVAEHEMLIEQLRQRLVRECQEFNTVDAFRFLDVRATGEITKEELMFGLSEIFLAQFSE